MSWIMENDITGSGAYLNPALAALVHPDKDVRQRAAVALGQLADSYLAPQVAWLLWQETNFFVRETVTWVLTQTPAQAAESAEAALVDGDIGTRVQALHLLSKLGDPDTVATVSRHIDDPAPTVADIARWALARIGDPFVVPLRVERLGDTDLAGRDAMTHVLTQCGAAALPSVILALTAKGASVRAHASEVWCFIGSPAASEAIPALIVALEDEHLDVRLGAALALCELVKHTAAHRALQAASRTSPDSRVRSVARATV